MAPVGCVLLALLIISQLSDCLGSQPQCVIRTISEARKILNESASNQDELKSSKALSALLDRHENDICSKEVISKFEQFHQKYIDPKSPDFQAHISPSLQSFFVQLSMQLSYHCTRILTKQLRLDRNLLTREDDERFQEITKPDGLLDFVLKDPKSYDHWTLLSDILNINSKSAPLENNERRAFSGPGDNLIIGVYSSCKKSFRPIYERRIWPVLKLAQLGYNYEPSQDRAYESISDSKAIRQWYKLTFLCDALLVGNFVTIEGGEYLQSIDLQAGQKFTEFEAERPVLEVPNLGDFVISDEIFETDKDETSAQSGKFKAKSIDLKVARKSLVKQLDSRVKRTILKRLNLKQIMRKNRPKMQINLTQLVEDIRAERRKPPNRFNLLSPSTDLLVTLVLALTPIIGWLILTIGFIFMHHEDKEYSQLVESSGLIINI